MLYILLLISLIFVLIANVVTRVGADSTLSNMYKNFPKEMKVNNEILLKIYFVVPKSMVTKSSFSIYLIQLIMFLILLIFTILDFCGIISANIEKIVWIVFFVITLLSSIICFIFDGIIGYINNKK